MVAHVYNLSTLEVQAGGQKFKAVLIEKVNLSPVWDMRDTPPLHARTHTHAHTKRERIQLSEYVLLVATVTSAAPCPPPGIPACFTASGTARAKPPDCCFRFSF